MLLYQLAFLPLISWCHRIVKSYYLSFLNLNFGRTIFFERIKERRNLFFSQPSAFNFITVNRGNSGHAGNSGQRVIVFLNLLSSIMQIWEEI